jgi:hypothetical protein
MQITKKEIPAIFYEEIIYDELGESDGKYCIGDKIKVIFENGAMITGNITKIIFIEFKFVHQIQINNGWWVHPKEWFGDDEITILEKYNKQNSQI